MPHDTRSALVISVGQFFFFTSWVVYAIYLKELLARAGLDPQWFLWIILADQVIFAVSDTAMGYAADRVERALGRVGPFLLGVNALSCALFIGLPFIAGAEQLPGRGPLLLGAILLWVATSSVLRAPPLVLLMKYAAMPRAPWLAAVVLFGLALGGSASPYLGQLLKGLDPALPFAVTGLSLLAATVPLVALERRRAVGAAAATVPMVPPQPAPVAALLVAALCIGMGFQLHTALAAKPLFLRHTGPEMLVWLLPMFWVGFKLAVFPGAWAARRLGPPRVLAAAALLGALGLWGSAQAPDLAWLIGWQLLAGGAWGVLFMAGISSALGLGRSGREGLVLGLWFSALSLAALLRIGLVLGGLPALPEFQPWTPDAPWALWLLGLPPLLYLALRRAP